MTDQTTAVRWMLALIAELAPEDTRLAVLRDDSPLGSGDSMVIHGPARQWKTIMIDLQTDYLLLAHQAAVAACSSVRHAPYQLISVYNDAEREVARWGLATDYGWSGDVEKNFVLNTLLAVLTSVHAKNNRVEAQRVVQAALTRVAERDEFQGAELPGDTTTSEPGRTPPTSTEGGDHK